MFDSSGSEVSITHELLSRGERPKEIDCVKLDGPGVEGVDAFKICEPLPRSLDVEELGVVSKADNRRRRRRRI